MAESFEAESFEEYRRRVLGYLGSRDPLEAAHDLNHLRQIDRILAARKKRLQG